MSTMQAAARPVPAAVGGPRPGAAPDSHDGPAGSAQVLTAAEDFLSHSAPLLRVLGLERFGLTDPVVARFVGSLPGAECHQGAKQQVSVAGPVGSVLIGCGGLGARQQ